MNKYRIKLHPEGYYTIQKRYLFIFWREVRFYKGDYINTKIWHQPPLETLQLWEKYGH